MCFVLAPIQCITSALITIFTDSERDARSYLYVYFCYQRLILSCFAHIKREKKQIRSREEAREEDAGCQNLLRILWAAAVRDKAEQETLLNFLNMFSCSLSLCVDTWSDGMFPARSGFGWPNWTGVLLRMKGWVGGWMEELISPERGMESRSYKPTRRTAWTIWGQIPSGSQQ